MMRILTQQVISRVFPSDPYGTKDIIPQFECLFSSSKGRVSSWSPCGHKRSRWLSILATHGLAYTENPPEACLKKLSLFKGRNFQFKPYNKHLIYVQSGGMIRTHIGD
jgi:hypothetical protein